MDMEWDLLLVPCCHSSYQALSGEIVKGSSLDYKVRENETYTFEVTYNEGRKTVESIIINNILAPVVLDIELPKAEVKLNDEVEVYLSIDNVENIKSEEATIKYDPTKLKFLSMNKTEGQRFIRTSKITGEIKVILSSKDGMISNGFNMERKLSHDECECKVLTCS